jgi:hypothetical protein
VILHAIEEVKTASKKLIKNLVIFFLFPSKEFLQIPKFSCWKLPPKNKRNTDKYFSPEILNLEKIYLLEKDLNNESERTLPI